MSATIIRNLMSIFVADTQNVTKQGFVFDYAHQPMGSPGFSSHIFRDFRAKMITFCQGKYKISRDISGLFFTKRGHMHIRVFPRENFEILKF